jgi:hypothetical protein
MISCKLIVLLKLNEHVSMSIRRRLLLIASFVAQVATYAQPSQRINYFGETVPDTHARLFAKGIISTPEYEHSSPVFSPNGDVVLWTIMSRDYRASIFEMRYANGQWSQRVRPSFADSASDDYYPSFSTDGTTLYFSSRRKAADAAIQTADMRIWKVDRTSTGWGRPVPFDTVVSKGGEYAHSVVNDGSIFFSSALNSATSWDLLHATNKNGKYARPEPLPYPINSVDYEEGPCVAPDGSFIIFESQRPEGIDGSLDLYISFRNSAGEWSLPLNMGTAVNSAASERFARISPDGRFLFFGSNRNPTVESWGFDIYWIDIGIVQKLKKQVPQKHYITRRLGMALITALRNNDTQLASRLLSAWHRKYPGGLDPTILYSSMLRKQRRFASADSFLKGGPASWKQNSAFIMETALVRMGLGRLEEASNLLAPLLVGDQRRERYKYISNALIDMGMYAESDKYFEMAMAIAANMYEYQRRARKFAVAGEKDKAFENLKKAVEFGLNSKRDFESDKDLDTLKADARWNKFMEQLK